MARLKYYTQTLASSYVLLAANVAYTLGSVPLALHYLSKEEFGLWALTSQLAGYMGLLDFGMAGAAMRVLIDFKDNRETQDYGSTILTSLLVNVAQGAIMMLCGVGLAFALGPLLQIPPSLSERFLWLMIGQAALMGVSLACRIASVILSAHQRHDLVNLSQAASFALSFVVLWACFASGTGVFSLLWAASVGQMVAAPVAFLACVRLRLLPRGKLWGRSSWDRFRDLFAFGRDMLLYSIGNQLVNASQTILITRVLDLQTAAVWSICTRAFWLLTQVVFKIFDSACAALAEMIVRGEQQRLFFRFRSMVILSGSLSVLVGVGLAVSNQPFVEWWTGGRIRWPVWNDCLLALWLPILVLVRSHTGLVGLTKEFRLLRYLYFMEGFFFVAVALLVLSRGGVPAMLGASILGSLLFSFPYSIYRTGQYFGVRWKDVVWRWMQPTVRFGLVLVPVAAVIAWLARSMDPLPRLIVCAGAVGGLGGPLLLRLGLDEAMRQELSLRILRRPGWVQRLWRRGPEQTE